jgi:hypothetical protein
VQLVSNLSIAPTFLHFCTADKTWTKMPQTVEIVIKMAHARTHRAHQPKNCSAQIAPREILREHCSSFAT